MGCLRNKSWKPECVGSFNMDWRILVFYPEPEARCQKLKFAFLLLEYCKIRECYAVANAFTIRNMYSLLLYMKCNSRWGFYIWCKESMSVLLSSFL
jgi:hypothetical protein